ncbi:DUF1761 domain-containing protein [Candidatus Woesearchaeota archaeon]|nr:DUF1761 domain-containing protein [Candidatus Woesearchaeota archaeon]
MVYLFGVTVNMWAVLVAAIAWMVMAAIWYAPPVFGKAWMRLGGIHSKDAAKVKKNMWLRWLIGFGSSLVLSYALAVFIGLIGGGVMTAIYVGLFLWLGLVATLTLGSVLWDMKPFGLYVLNNGFNVLGFLVMSIILGAWI